MNQKIILERVNQIDSSAPETKKRMLELGIVLEHIFVKNKKPMNSFPRALYVALRGYSPFLEEELSVAEIDRVYFDGLLGKFKAL